MCGGVLLTLQLYYPPAGRDPHNHLVCTSLSSEISHRKAHIEFYMLGQVLSHTDAVGMWTTFKELLRRQSGESIPERLVFTVTYGVKSSNLAFSPAG